MSLRLVVLSLCLVAGSATAAAPANLVIGVENQPYLPAFTYEHGEYRGFARELFDAFAKDRGYRIEYRALPVPRLYASFFDGQVDFKFPDNPHWKSEQRGAHKIVYSDPVMASMDGVFVVPGGKVRQADDVQVLGTVSGFTPWAWSDRIKAGKVAVSENTGFDALIRQTLAGRVDGAYANVAVVNYQLEQVLHKPGALQFRADFPSSRNDYHLASIRHPEVVREFNQWLKQNRATVAALKKKHGVEKGVVSD